jgi:hypothetical protein
VCHLSLFAQTSPLENITFRFHTKVDIVLMPPLLVTEEIEHDEHRRSTNSRRCFMESEIVMLQLYRNVWRLLSAP